MIIMSKPRPKIGPVINTSGFAHRQDDLSLVLSDEIEFCFYYMYDGVANPNKPDMLSYLMAREIVSCWKDWTDNDRLKLMVNSSDTFAWGCSDADEIDLTEIQCLFDLVWNYMHGDIIWLCLKRDEQPQRPMKEILVNSNSWIPELAKLKPNFYDAWCEEKYRKDNE